MIPVARDLWTNRFFPGAELFQGIEAIATDADWSCGEGLGVTGPIEALILTLAGRFAALDQLQGDGTATLLIAQQISGGGEGLISPKTSWPTSRRYVSLLGEVGMSALCR